MKKALSIILVLVMCLSLCACGATSLTKEEMISSATTFWLADFESAYAENPKEAEKNYVGKIVKFVAIIDEFGTDSNNYNVKVHSINANYKSFSSSWIYINLPTEEVEALSVGDKIAVVGEISGLILTDRIYMESAYTYPIFDCLADQIEPMIEFFGKNDGDIYADEDESTAFFREFKDDFPMLENSEIQEQLIGTWYVKDTFGVEFEYTFNADGTSTTTYNGKNEHCTWVLNGNYIYLDLNGGEVNTQKAIKIEVRKLNENSIMLYQNDFGKYNGTSYKMDQTCAVLVRK